jgi:primosomal protein N' (replication factor Y)
MTAEIAVAAAVYAIDKPYSYQIPEGMTVLPGMRVTVPFGRGNRRSEGVVLSVDERCDPALKPVGQLLDPKPVLSGQMLRLAAFIRERYFCTFFDAIRAMLPAGMWFAARDTYTVSALPDDWRSQVKRKPSACAVMDAILAFGGTAEHTKLAQQFEEDPLDDALRYLLNKKWLTAETNFLRRVGDKTEKLVSLCMPWEETETLVRQKRKSAALQASVLELLRTVGCCGAKELCYYTGASMATLNRLETLGCISFTTQEVLRLRIPPQEAPAAPLVLNREQQAAYEGLLEQSRQEKPGVALLYGVTGSGKTSVYLKLIEQCMASGRQAIVLVPEIALTPQLLGLFSSYFGENVAVLHSSLRVAERYDTFKRIARGDASVVIGTRSAVFAPVPRLGLMVVDEEQEHTYKSENNPRYHGREVAIFRGAKENALVVLGSATPSVESMYRAQTGVYRLYTLRSRFNRQELPPVELVDMKQELKEGNGGAISSVLLDALRENVRLGQQSILFLNRRGSSRLTVCIECGDVPSCPRCSVHLTYHQANGRLMCHLCGYSQPLPERCPKCAGHFKQVGFGTQRVAEELETLLPGTGVLRMDADTVSAANPHEKILDQFKREKIPILLGTQMVTKGLNFENVTLVGVMNADQSLYAPSYRAAETTFSLITQVVGRAGRGQAPGRAVIQTMTPENTVLCLAAAQDYDRFYASEIHLRELRECPPFCDQVTVSFTGLFEADVQQSAARFRQMCEAMLQQSAYRGMHATLLGPAPAAIVKVNNRYCYQLTAACRLEKPMRQMLAYLLREFSRDKKNRGVTAFADVNSCD